MRRGLAQSVLETVRRQELLHPGDRVSAAISAGADSVALLLLLMELRERLGIVISVAHFNHQLRGRASDADEKFVAKLAVKHGLAFHVEREDVAARAKREKANLEDAARRARYAFFGKLVAHGHASHVAVAHTADDQAETVLAHILRGTGLAGLGGIHPTVGHVVRPLLQVRRAELRAYLKSHQQTWREDATNRDTTKMRAHIRKKLLPLLEKQFQPAVVEHLASLAELAREDEAFLESVAEERFLALVKKNAGSARIAIVDLLQPVERAEFNTESTESTEGKEKRTTADALIKRLVRRIIQNVKKGEGQLTAQHVRAVLDLAARGENGKFLQLPAAIEVRRENDALIFLQSGGTRTKIKKNTTACEYQYNIDLHSNSVLVPIQETGCAFRFTAIDWPRKRGETSNTGSVLDRERLRFPLLLRNRRPGDKLQPAGRRNAHKLKRLLNEKRISRWERAGWPVLTSGGVIAWAKGFPVAAEFAVTERTRAAIVIVEENL